MSSQTLKTAKRRSHNVLISIFKVSDKVKRYSRIKSLLTFCGVLMPAISALIFHFFISGRVITLTGSFFEPWPLLYFIYLIIFAVFIYLLTLPLSFTNSFVLERVYGLSSRGFRSWAADESKSAVLYLLFFVGSAFFLYAALYFFPRGWWIATGIGWILLTLFISLITPTVIIPIFFKYLPIHSDEIREKIKDLAHKTGIKIRDISRLDMSRKTTKANAALVGIGATRKVVISDTLTDNFSPDEVEAVIAHEFGHHKLFHMPKIIAFSCFLVFAGFYILHIFSSFVTRFSGAEQLLDIRTFPVIFFFAQVLGVLILPLRNLFLRHLEREADDYALYVTGVPGPFISAMRKLSGINFSDPAPPLLRKIFLYTHPPINERISRAWKVKL